MQSTVESMITRMMSTAFKARCSRNRLSTRSPLCWFNEYMHVQVVILQLRAYRIFACLRLFHFLDDFHTRCHIQGQGFGNKMYISKLFTVVGYLHTAGFKNGWGINFAKCINQNLLLRPQFQTKKSVQETLETYLPQFFPLCNPPGLCCFCVISHKNTCDSILCEEHSTCQNISLGSCFALD